MAWMGGGLETYYIEDGEMERRIRDALEPVK